MLFLLVNPYLVVFVKFVIMLSNIESLFLTVPLVLHILEIIHVDLWGPYPHCTYNDYKYFLTIINDYSWATWTHLLAAKSNAFAILKSFVSFVKTQFQTSVKVIRSDNG